MKPKKSLRRKLHTKYFFLAFIVPFLVISAVGLAILARTAIGIDAAQRQNVDDIITTIEKIISELPEEAFRATFSSGGENAWDLMFFFIAFTLSFVLLKFGGRTRASEYLTQNQIDERIRRGKFVEKEELKNRINKNGEKEYFCYTESKNSLKFKRFLKISIGFSLVTFALCLKPFIFSITNNFAYRGLTQTAFSFLFVCGMLFFAGAVRGILNSVENKLELQYKPKLRIAFNLGLLVGSSVLAGYLNVIAAKIQTSYKDAAGQVHFIFGNFALANILTAAAVLLGIAVFGRMPIENMLKPWLIKKTMFYNKLMGENGNSDKLTNLAIANNCDIKYLDGVRIIVPNGRKLLLNSEGKFQRLLLLEYEKSSQAEKNQYAIDKDNNYYRTEDDIDPATNKVRMKNHKARHLTKLALWMIFWYSSTLFFYAANYTMGEVLTPALNLLTKNTDQSIFIGSFFSDTAYLFAILSGIQAVEIFMKILNVFVDDKKFLDEYREKSNGSNSLNNDDLKKLTKLDSDYTKRKFASWGVFAGSCAGLLAFAICEATKQFSINNFVSFAIEIIVFAICRVAFSLAIHANERNKQIDEFLDEHHLSFSSFGTQANEIGA